MEQNRDLLSRKMSAELSPPTKEKTSEVSSKKSVKSQMKHFLSLNLRNGKTQEKSWEKSSHLRGEFLMLSFGESPKDENASTLSQILEAGVPQKYYLSQKACLGILRRASVRGKTLPRVLEQALHYQASIA